MKVDPMRSSQCGAKTRAGHPCRSHPVTGRRRCRMHGGAPGSGAPLGNRNAPTARLLHRGGAATASAGSATPARGQGDLDRSDLDLP